MYYLRLVALFPVIAVMVGQAFAQTATIPVQNYSQVAGLWYGTTKHGTRVVLQIDPNGQCFSGTNHGTGKCGKFAIQDGGVRVEWGNGSGHVTLKLTSAGTLEGRFVNGQYVTDNIVYTKQ